MPGFIVIEGPNNSGKTTIATSLKKSLAGTGIPETDIINLREPGGTPFGEDLRHSLKTTPGTTPFAQALAMNAARAQLAKKEILPALAAGKTIICDRYTPSSEVYQIMLGNLGDKETKLIRQIHALLPVPDIIIYMIPPINILKERAAKKKPETDVFEKQNQAEREHTAYRKLHHATKNNEGKPAIILLSQTNPNIQELGAAVHKHLRLAV
jgi:dTMP kinase